MPQNNGESMKSSVAKNNYIKTFEIVLENMEGRPKYPLAHQLTIGKEVGNIVLADESLASKHATFVLQDNVVSIVDHNTLNGTYINDQRIQSGRFIILDESDHIKLGDLEVTLKVGHMVQKVDEEFMEEIELDQEVKTLPKKEEKKLKLVSVSRSHSTNAVVRVLSLMADFLLAYTVTLILSPLPEYKDLTHHLPQVIESVLGVMQIETLISMAQMDFSSFVLVVKDVYENVLGEFDLIPLVATFISLRLVGILLFGVSFSELFLGTRAQGHVLWKRVGGVLREFLSYFMLPFFFLTDLPCLFSRRTLKEVLTNTQLIYPSKLIGFLSTIVYFPLLVGLFLLSPLVKGLSLPEPIFISEKIEKRPKLQDVADTAALMRHEMSENLGLNIDYDERKLFLYPTVEINKEKRKFKSALYFYDKELNRQVRFEILKKFNSKRILQTAMHANMQLMNRFPRLYEFAFSIPEQNPFKNVDAKKYGEFSLQYIELMKLAFELHLDNAQMVFENETFLLEGLLNFKEDFIKNLERDDFQKLSFIQLGDFIFFKASYVAKEPFDLLIPLFPQNGVIYKITFDQQKDLKDLSARFYFNYLDKVDWFSRERMLMGESLTTLQFFDFFHNMKFKNWAWDEKGMQALYQTHYNLSIEVLKNNQDYLRQNFIKTLKSFKLLIDQTLPTPMDTEASLKFKQNMSDLMIAVEAKDYSFFQLTPPEQQVI